MLSFIWRKPNSTLVMNANKGDNSNTLSATHSQISANIRRYLEKQADQVGHQGRSPSPPLQFHQFNLELHGVSMIDRSHKDQFSVYPAIDMENP